MYLGVSPFRRFAAFIIDLGLIVLVASLILIGILRLINFDTVYFNDLQNNLANYYVDYIIGRSDYILSQEAMNEMVEYAKLYVLREGIRLGLIFILHFLYLVILPYFFKYQTIGRLIAKSRVIYNKKPDGKVPFGMLVVREMIGTFIFYSLISIVGFVSMILACVTGKSLVDRISNTSMVLDVKIPITEEFRQSFFSNKEEDFKNNEFIDADVTEVNEEPVKDEEKNDDVNNNDDDEYKVI